MREDYAVEIIQDFTTSLCVPVYEPTEVAEARRKASGLARVSGFSETRTGDLAIVVSEAATNLVKHADGGEIVLSLLRQGRARGVQVLALDKGRGMDNLQECMRDGFSTAGSSGTGLGAIQRQSSLFDIFSLPGKGTALLAVLWEDKLPPQMHTPLITGAVCLPITEEESCGDAWAVEISGEETVLFVADGLGHGSRAAEASQKAVEVFRANKGKAAEECMRLVHLALKSTRGAAASMAALNPATGSIRYLGVGNVTGTITSLEKTQHMVSHNGTLGMETRRLQQFTYTCPEDALVVMYSDGLQTQWNLLSYPGLMRRHPALVAGVLYRDYSRRRDDVTVLVAKRASL